MLPCSSAMAGWVVCVLVGVSTATGQTEAVALATDFEPEAPAVYLEESSSWTIDKKRHHLEVRKRILLRSRDGFEHADHYFFYDADNSELVSFSARTVLPDGSHRPVPDDLIHENPARRHDGKPWQAVQFTFPAVEPGAVLEWEYVVESDEVLTWPFWKVQKRIPVRESRYLVKYRERRRKPRRVRRYSSGDWPPWCENLPWREQGRYEVEETVCQRIPAAEQGAFARTHTGTLPRLLIAYEPDTSRPYAEHYWGYFGRQLYERIEGFAKVPDSAHAMLRSLQESASSDQELVKAIYRHVKSAVQVRGKGHPRPAESVQGVLEKGAGSPFEVTTALLALLREADLPATPLLVGGKRGPCFDVGSLLALLASAEDSLLVEVELESGRVYLDPACRRCSAGVIDWRHCAGAGRGLKIDGYTMPHTTAIPVPAPSANRVDVQQTLHLHESGEVDVEGSILWKGQLELRARDEYAELSDVQRREEILDRLGTRYPEGDATVSMSEPDDVGSPFRVRFSYRTSDRMLVTESRLLARPSSAALAWIDVPVEREEDPSTAIPCGQRVEVEETFLLPYGYTLESLPPSASIEVAGAAFDARWEALGCCKVVWTGVLEINRSWFESETRRDMRSFLAGVRRLLRDGLTLVRDTPDDGSRAP